MKLSKDIEANLNKAGFKNSEEFFQKTCLVYSQCMACARLFQEHPEKNIYEVPFKNLPDFGDIRLYGFYAMDINNYLKKVKNIENAYYLDYNGKKIIFRRRTNRMKYNFNVEIPYAKRSKYRDFIIQVNRLVDISGNISLWVNNNPYALQSFLLIETEKNGEKINQLIEKYELRNDLSKGLDEYLMELGYRAWNTMSIMQGDDYVDLIFNLYEFAEEEYLEKKGFAKEEIKRKKVFISYCHADKEIVYGLVDKMKMSGLYIWIDTQEIDAGDSILEKVMSGIDESDLCVMFVSKATINAQFAQHELKTVWSKLIYGQKKWFIIKLDDVDMGKVHYGLEQYLYFEIKSENDADELINAIKKKLEKINKK